MITWQYFLSKGRPRLIWLRPALGRMPGMSAEDADAASAYTQAELRGPPAWITLPRDRWPKEWF
eukprot:1738005-Karenia_brevis.AAC.1